MKKALLTILICGIIVLGITGCNNSTIKDSDNIDSDDIHSFVGTVIECKEEFMIIRPNKNEEEYNYGDKYKIEYVGEFNSCNAGDKVKITYKGMINTSNPAQIGTTKIEIVSEE